MNPVRTLLRKANRKEDQPLNILSVSTHERYETGLAKTGHNFFDLNGHPFKTWDTNYAPVPKNIHIIEHKGVLQLPNIDFDLVLSHSKYGQYQALSQIAGELHLPLVCLEHTLPMPSWPMEHVQQVRQLRGHYNVFISEYSRGKWLWGPNEADVIHHGVDTDVFNDFGKERQPHILSVVNDWINRDEPCGFTMWKEATVGLPVFPVGGTPGLSVPAKDVDELVKFYNEAQVFINTSLVSPVPTALLEAMSCGCCVVSTNTCMIPEIIKDGYNGFLGANPSELRKKLEIALKTPDLRKQLGENARKTILEKFSMDTFVTKWNDLFNKAKHAIFRGDFNEA